jgi:hypothetical protein
MAAKGGAQQTVVDGLKSLYTDVAGLMLLPDSAQHQQFLTTLMSSIQGYVQKQGMAAVGQPMPGGPPGAPPGGPPGGGPPGGPTPPGMPSGSGGPTGPPAQGPPPGAGGPMRGNNTAPNPDELRRVLQMTG